MEDKELLEMALRFHGHRCPAVPLGLRVGLAALRELGVKRAENKELHCICETGSAHAAMCFVDGVQAATGCTYGKSNIEKIEYSKNAITLIDVKRKKAVRVTCNPEAQKKGLSSEFVKLRSQGVEPQDIDPEIGEPGIERIMNAPEENIIRIGEVFDIDFEPRDVTFEWSVCEDCGEVVFSHGVRLVDGKKICIPCAEKG